MLRWFWLILPCLNALGSNHPYDPALPESQFIEATYAALSPDETQIAICMDKKAIIRPLKGKEPTLELNTNDRFVRAVYSPDGKYLALQEEYELSIYKRAAHVTLVRLADGYTRSYFRGWLDTDVPGSRIAFSPDSKWLAFLRNQLVYLKSLEDNIESAIDTMGTARSIAFSPDSSVIITAGDSRIVYISTADKRIVKTPILASRENAHFFFRGIAFSRDGSRLAASGVSLDEDGRHRELRILRLSDHTFESIQPITEDGEELFFVMEDRGLIVRNQQKFFGYDFNEQTGALKPAYLPDSQSAALSVSPAPRSPFLVRLRNSKYNGPELGFAYYPKHWNPLRLEDRGVKESNGSLFWNDDLHEYRFNFRQPIFEDAVETLTEQGYRLANPDEVETALEALTKSFPWGEWHRPMQTFLDNGHIWTDYPTGDRPSLKWVYSTPNTKLNNLRSHKDWIWDWSMARFDHRACSACAALGVRDRALPP